MKNSVKVLFRIFVTSFVIFCCNLSKGDNNLLSNPSFEESGTGVPAAGWNSYHCGYSRSDDVSEDGSWSCKITGSGGAEEAGLGGTYQTISGGLPLFEKFAVSSNIYIASYTQGKIYGIYVSVNYTDSSQQTFSRLLSAAEISANLNCWKNYRLVFSSDSAKTISSINCWCLVWADNDDKFIGTIYFDDLKFGVFKPALYWPADRIYTAVDNDAAAADVAARGFTHALVNPFDDNQVKMIFLDNKGFDIVKTISPTSWHLAYTPTPRYFSPYTEGTAYATEKDELETYLSNYPEITGIADDFELPPFPMVTYSIDGTAAEYTYPDLDERIGGPSDTQDWPVFKDWPETGDHDVGNLTITNIEYNFPSLCIDNSGTPTGYNIIGYYGSGFTYASYEMAAQTFKPTDSRITRIDVIVKRLGNAYPLGDLYFYLTEVDANGKPDLSNKISYPVCTVKANEIDYSPTWSGIEPLSLYFDPVEVGELDTDKQYALVLEFTKKDSNDWNNSYYLTAGFNTDVYNNGQAWKRSNGVWVGISGDLWMKVYKPNPPAGFALNQFHEDWIDFQCAVNARFVEDYCEAADSVSPAREVWIYSGYEDVCYPARLHNYDGTTRRSYSVDWEMMAATGINYAVCGYGTQSITATQDALSAGNPSRPPKLIGGGYTPCGEASFLDRYENCDGAMLYYGGIYDNDDPGWSIP